MFTTGVQCVQAGGLFVVPQEPQEGAVRRLLSGGRRLGAAERVEGAVGVELERVPMVGAHGARAGDVVAP